MFFIKLINKNLTILLKIDILNNLIKTKFAFNKKLYQKNQK